MVRERAKGGPAAEFAARLAAVMRYRGLGVMELARKARTSRNSLGRYLDPKSAAKPPKTRFRRRFEEVLGLPPLALDQGTPAELLALLQHAPQRATEPPPAPLQGRVGNLEAAFRFVRSQLEGYRMTGRLVQPQVVVIWLSELEAAATASAEVGALTSIERADTVKRAAQTAEEPSLRPPGRTG